MSDFKVVCPEGETEVNINGTLRAHDEVVSMDASEAEVFVENGSLVAHDGTAVAETPAPAPVEESAKAPEAPVDPVNAGEGAQSTPSAPVEGDGDDNKTPATQPSEGNDGGGETANPPTPQA